MKGEEKPVKKAVEQVGETLKQTTPNDYEKLMQKAAANAVTLRISDAQAEGIYAQAYHLYNTGKYKDAFNLFRLLVMINATEAKFIPEHLKNWV